MVHKTSGRVRKATCYIHENDNNNTTITTGIKTIVTWSNIVGKANRWADKETTTNPWDEVCIIDARQTAANTAAFKEIALYNL